MHVKEHNIKRIVVDARNYFFRDNIQIQNWINYTYLPLLMDSNVTKYAIIIDSEVMKQPEDLTEDDTMKVEYFSNSEDALQWINS